MLEKQLAYQTKSYRDFILQNSTKYVDEQLFPVEKYVSISLRYFLICFIEDIS
jgi:hypothetical protein